MEDDFRMGAEICQWVIMQTVTPLYLKCAISQTMKNQKNHSDELFFKLTSCNTRPSKT